ncbi:MAG: HAD family hydrolase [Candidatus Asgardarchaeia archaeon]
MSLKCVIFDLVNTLIDPSTELKAHEEFVSRIKSRYRLEGEVKELLEMYNSLHKREVDRSIREDPSFVVEKAVIETFRIWTTKLGLSLNDNELNRLLEEYWEVHYEFLRIRDGTKEVLNELKSLGLKLGILSDDSPEVIREIMDRNEILGYFDAITSSYEAGKTKPHPSAFKKALDKIGCCAEDSLMVGDSLERDIKGAKSIGMKTVLIVGGMDFPRNFREDCKPDFVIEDMRELLNVVKDLL